MVARKSGGIVNVASIAAFQPGPKMALYCATKAFVLSLSEALHEELKPHGVHVTALCPGPTRTEFGDVAGFGGSRLFERLAMESPEVVEAGLTGLDRNRAVVIPGLDEQSRDVGELVDAAAMGSQNRGIDQILRHRIEPARGRRRYQRGIGRGDKEQEWPKSKP